MIFDDFRWFEHETTRHFHDKGTKKFRNKCRNYKQEIDPRRCSWIAKDETIQQVGFLRSTSEIRRETVLLRGCSRNSRKEREGVKRLSKASFISERRESGLVSNRGQVEELVEADARRKINSHDITYELLVITVVRFSLIFSQNFKDQFTRVHTAAQMLSSYFALGRRWYNFSIMYECRCTQYSRLIFPISERRVFLTVHLEYAGRSTLVTSLSAQRYSPSA